MLKNIPYVSLCILFLAALAVVTLVILGLHAIRIKTGVGPRMSVRASVRSKRTALGSSTDGKELDYFTLFFATFRMDDGETAELALDRQEYETLVVNSTGILTYKGNRMVKFDVR